MTLTLVTIYEIYLCSVGIDLGIKHHVIGQCREDNKSSINQAVLDMLCKWYKTQDGLGRNSEGLKKLEQVCCW